MLKNFICNFLPLGIGVSMLQSKGNNYIPASTIELGASVGLGVTVGLRASVGLGVTVGLGVELDVKVGVMLDLKLCVAFTIHLYCT